jgi:hypothetical protein
MLLETIRSPGQRRQIIEIVSSVTLGIINNYRSSDNSQIRIGINNLTIVFFFIIVAHSVFFKCILLWFSISCYFFLLWSGVFFLCLYAFVAVRVHCSLLVYSFFLFMNNGIIATQHTTSNANRGKMFLTKGNI